jgi:hypothetical protein
MKTKSGVCILIILGFCLVSGMSSHTAAHSSTKEKASLQNITRQIDKQKINNPPENAQNAIVLDEIPLYFVPNQGQFDRKALFLANTTEYKIWITRSGLLFDSLWKKEEATPDPEFSPVSAPKKNNQIQRSVSAVHFLGAHKDVHVEASDVSEYRVHYLLGKNPDQWHTDIQTSRVVLYKNLYRNIDLKLYGKGSRLEYDWQVKPGGNPTQIQLRYLGAKNVDINDEGDLLIETDLCALVHEKPHAFQTIEGKEITVEAKYQKTADKTFSFSLGPYDPAHALIIDPVVFIYSTFLGASELDEAYDIAVDNKGRPFITGATESTDFPTTEGVYGPLPTGGTDVFITKFNSKGTDLIFSTYLGGRADDEGFAIALDPEGEGFAHITGTTQSADFPTTPGVYDRSINGRRDLFVAKLNKKGSALKFSTFVGGSNDDNGFGITLDSEGAIYVTGSTDSNDFPTTKGADDRTFGGQVDAFAIKIDSEASSLLYATYIGDVEIETCFDIAVDSTGAAYVTGFIDPGRKADSDVLAVKLRPKGSRQDYSFVFGGGDDESGRGITVDEFGFAYIVGWTESSNFPTTPEAFDRTHNGHTDAFVSKLRKNGTGFVFSTYLGGNCWDWGEDIDIYEDYSAIVTGYTTAADFPVTPDAFDTIHNGKVDAFVTKFDPPGSFLEYSTFLGGDESDYGMGIVLDKDEVAHTTGYTSSADFPATPDAYDQTFNLISDAYYVKFALVWPISINITHPLNGANVAGLVSVDADVASEAPVADVKFYVDGELMSTDIDSPYGFDWDTSGLPNGSYKIMGWATDTNGIAAYHEITALILNGTLDLQVERDMYKTWLFEKPYAELDMTVLSSEVQDKADYYAFFRKTDGEDFVQIIAFPRTDLVNNTITFKDMPLDADKTYTYYALAVTAIGEILGISPEITR